MNRQEIHTEIQTALGLVPGFFKGMPDDSLEMEWGLFKRYVLQEESQIPPKYRELIGVAAAAARQCWYCSNFHTGGAKHHGAPDEEIQEAVHLARFGAGWSAYLNGTVYDRDLFMRELQEVGGYLSNK
jgi:AhpD family alkylhydroperoxidase